MIEKYDVDSRICDSIVWLSSNALGAVTDHEAVNERIKAVRNRIKTIIDGDPVSDYPGFHIVQYEIILDELGEEIGRSFDIPNNVVQMNLDLAETPEVLAATA